MFAAKLNFVISARGIGYFLFICRLYFQATGAPSFCVHIYLAGYC